LTFVQGGGNTSNSLVAAARLGVSCRLFSKLGEDANGDAIVQGLAEEGVDTSAVLRQEGAPSPFTYIVVDCAGGTRTCIHTPGPPCCADELSESATASLLAGAGLVSFDGRLGEPAAKLATAARRAGVPVLVEAERPRPGLDGLLALADFAVASQAFPAAWTGLPSEAAALLACVARLPAARLLVTTLGRRGSVAIERVPSASAPAETLDEPRLAALLASLPPPDDGGSSAAQPRPASASRLLWLPAWGSAARVVTAPAASLSSAAVVDTTGAGDAFIGTLAACLLADAPLELAMELASWTAAVKCTGVGARAALPRLAQLPPHLRAVLE